jgi:Holliday junction resolvase-like predicted endonuclease
MELISLLDEHVTKGRVRGANEVHYYPSEASVKIIDSFGDTVVHGHCLRQAYFRCKGAPRVEPAPRQQWIFRLGSAVEAMLIEEMKQAGVWEADHVKWYNKERNVSGELDVIIKDKETDTLVGVEIKSFYGYFAEKEILGSRGQRGQPKMNHLLQTLVYADQFHNEVDHFDILYMDRGAGKRRVFKAWVLLDELEDGTIIRRPVLDDNPIMDFTMEDVYDRYKQLGEAVNSSTPPAQEFELYYDNDKIEDFYKKSKLAKTKYDKFHKKGERPGDWQCSYCPYRKICWDG